MHLYPGTKTVAKIFCISLFAVIAWFSFEDPILKRAALLSALCLGLWLTEFIPLYATSLLLIFSVPLLLAPWGADFSFGNVVLWPSNPVLALFFGGFALGVAGKKYGIDAHMARVMLHLSRGKSSHLVLLIMIGTAILSMWMSNIAASAMMLVALRPLWKSGIALGLRKASLLAIAFGANFGGMATPIGTGPNAIAIATIENTTSISFLRWMFFAFPLTMGMLLCTFLILRFLHPMQGSIETPPISLTLFTRKNYAVIGIFFLAVLVWLFEPLHKIPAAAIAIGVAALLFGTRLLTPSDLGEIDWATLILIAGGLTLGELVDRSGLAKTLASFLDWSSIPRQATILILVLSTAFLSAIASNTAASVLMIQLGARIDPSPDLPVLIALGASLGAPFIISTPPNAMVYGEGGIHPKDLLIPGLILMILGCILITLSGPAVLRFAGVN